LLREEDGLATRRSFLISRHAAQTVPLTAAVAGQVGLKQITSGGQQR
jgi:hypothetical protein